MEKFDYTVETNKSFDEAVAAIEAKSDIVCRQELLNLRGIFVCLHLLKG